MGDNSYVGACPNGSGMNSSKPIHRAILVAINSVTVSFIMLTTATWATTETGRMDYSQYKLTSQIETMEQALTTIVVTSILPQALQIQTSGRFADLPWWPKSDDMSRAYSAYIAGDYLTALSIIEPLAKRGDFKAQYILGYMYENGHVANQDYATAAKWYRKAADQGDAISEISLGLLYENGQGVAKDFAEAAKLYRSAADRGSARAHYRLGVMYRFGQGVPLDLVMAHVHFNIAAAGFTVRPAQVSRDSVARQMTANQLKLARQIAKEWLILHPPVSVGEPVGNIPE